MMIAAALLLPVPPAGAGGGFEAVTGPCGFQFPRDHGSHPDHRTEWWYYTGNLETEEGRPFGFQLTFFRRAIAPAEAEARWPRPRSAWRTRQIYLAHAAVTDLETGRHHQAETLSRGALGLAGAEPSAEGVRIHLMDWSAGIGGDSHELRADGDGFSLDLTLTPKKPPVPHGEDGYSRKGSRPEASSCYYSFTRMAVGGHIGIDGTDVRVTGLAWMDHEFSTAPLEPGLAGWDWFSIQLEDGTELMAYFLRDRKGGVIPASSATFVDGEGRGVHLEGDKLCLTALGTWKSPHSGITYPSGWRLSIPEIGMALEIRPRQADQEMRTPSTTQVTYWEGGVFVGGEGPDGPVRGFGYVELTGYGRPFDTPL